MSNKSARSTIEIAPELLATKLHVTPGPNAVPRLHLMARLNERLIHPVLLLSAPAGFGKTTLVSNMVESTLCPHASGVDALDDGDNDPARFLAYLFGAPQIDRA